MQHFLNTEIDKVQIPSISSSFYKNDNYNFVRIGKIILLYKFLCRHIQFSKLDNNKKHKIIKTLERKCYHQTIKISKLNDILNDWNVEEFNDLYHIICGRMIVYLEYTETDPNDVNKFIINMINSPEYVNKFPTLLHKNLYPKIYEEIEKRNIAGKQKKVKYSKLYKCPKCKKSLSTLANRYNRSADEGVNLMISCVYCGFERPG